MTLHTNPRRAGTKPALVAALSAIASDVRLEPGLRRAAAELAGVMAQAADPFGHDDLVARLEELASRWRACALIPDP